MSDRRSKRGFVEGDRSEVFHRQCKSLHGPRCDGSPQAVSAMAAILAGRVKRRRYTGIDGHSLASAVRANHVECVRLFLTRDADLSTCDNECRLVCRAIVNSYTLSSPLSKELLIMLMEAGLDVNKLVQMTINALFYNETRVDVVDLLELCFEYNADPNASFTPPEFNFRMSLLGVVTTKSVAGCVKLLLENGADPDLIVSRDEERPLLPPVATAIMMGDLRCAKYLLLYNAETNFERLHPVFHGTDCLDLVTEMPEQDITKMLHLLHKFGVKLWRGRLQLPPEESTCHRVLEELRGMPLSLQEWSRLAILRTMGRKYLKNLHNLGIPVTLYPYLEFDDLTC